MFSVNLSCHWINYAFFSPPFALFIQLFKLAAVPAGLALTSYGLYAASDREPKGDLLNPSQLPIYSVPLQKSKFIEEQPGRIEIGLSVARQMVSPYVVWSKVSGILDTIEFGKDSYVYLKNPPPEFLARAGIITVSGLAGLVLARKGKLKKIVYPMGLTALGISICYPAQAVLFAKVLTGRKVYVTSHRTYDAISSLWKTSYKELEKPKTGEGEQKVWLVSSVSRVYATRILHNAFYLNQRYFFSNILFVYVAPVPARKSSHDANLLDHGQSNPEDQDLYSTRS
uniref:MICOS complex subunit n=1 Tax=Leptobrachium leishanense TaxID=445787 RepID=A0A8C5N0L9_9ANUR